MNRKIISIISTLLMLTGVVSAQDGRGDSGEFLNSAFFPSEEFSFFGTKEYTEIKSRTITIYGGDDYHPYEFINENGDPDGFNVDYVAAIMDKIGLNYDLKLVKWPILMDALKNKEIDMVTGLAYTEEREKYARFSIITFVEYVSYISSKHSDFKDDSDLVGKRVSAVRGEFSEQVARQYCRSEDIVLFDNTSDAFESVYEGRSDIFFGMNIVMHSMIDQKNDDRLKISGFNNIAATYSIAVNPDQEALLQLINMAIIQLKMDGTYDALCDKWFSKAPTPLLSRNTKIIIFSLLVVLMVAFIFILVLKNQIRKAVQKEALLNRNLLNLQSRITMALEVGKIDAWMYDYDTKSFTVVSGERLSTAPGNSMPLDYFEDHIHPDDRQRIVEAIRKAQLDENSTQTYKFRFKTLKGWRWLFMAYTPIIENGVVTSLMGVRRDITPEIEYEQTLQKKIIDIKKHGDSLLSILDNIPTSIALKRIDTGEYSYSNKMALTKFGAVIGKSPSIEVISSTLEAKHGYSYNSNEGVYDAIEVVRIADGSIIETSVCSVIIDFKGENHELISRVDLTEQKIAKRDSELLSEFMPSLKAFSFHYDSRLDMVRLHHNSTFERDLSRITNVERWLEAVHHDDRDSFVRQLSGKSTNSKGVFQFRLDLREIGVYEWWECHNSVEIALHNGEEYALISGFSINVNDRVKSELEQKRLITQNELVMRNTNSLFAYITMDYHVLWSNADSALGGIAKNVYKMGGMKCYLAKGFDKPCETCPIKQALISNSVIEREALIDSGVWYKASAIPVYGADDAIQGAVMRIDDVSEYKKLIGELEVSMAKAEEADKLKSAFLANMSHEIRTPLNAIVGFSDLLVHSEDRSDREEYIQIINNNNELLLRLIGDILDLSKIESGLVELKLEYFDFSVMFSDLFATHKPRIERGNTKLLYSNPYSKCMVTLDKNRCIQVITNYLNNAEKFTRNGHISMGYEYENGGITLFVEDTGIGISEDKIDLLFHRFEKLDDFAQGTGLGLSICKAIAETMNGRVWAESKAGEGSTFFAWFPCVAEIEEMTLVVDHRDEDVVVEQVSSSLKRSILVAEDNDSNYMLVKAILKECNLTRAVNGQEAVDYARKYKYDAILMDMKMPVMGGLEATKAIREFDRVTNIVALTANVFDSDRTNAMEAGCNSFITKPLSRREIEKIIF